MKTQCSKEASKDSRETKENVVRSRSDCVKGPIRRLNESRESRGKTSMNTGSSVDSSRHH